jgi:hypothetical protein
MSRSPPTCDERCNIVARLSACDAASNGHLECLRYAHENGAPWRENTCTWAAYGGNVECLRYAHENGATFNQTTCVIASAKGHLDCLRYAHEAGAPWDQTTCIAAVCHVCHVHPDLLLYDGSVGSDTCVWDGRHDSSGCLRYAHEAGAPWPTTLRSIVSPILVCAVAATLVRERRRHYAAIRIGRAWRAWAERRRRRAVAVIENTVLEWLLRPGRGSAYRKAESRWQDTVAQADDNRQSTAALPSSCSAPT